MEDGKPEGSIKSEEDKETGILKPSLEFTGQNVNQLPPLSTSAVPVSHPNQILMHHMCNEFSTPSSSTPVQSVSHERHHRRRNRHGHSKPLRGDASISLLSGQVNKPCLGSRMF